MLFRQLAVVAASGLVIGAAASPLAGSGRDALTAVSRREVPATHALHERQNAQWSRQWAKRDRVTAKALLPMRIGLTQRNLDAGARHLKKM
jgi:tripeptidyl-peptidase I